MAQLLVVLVERSTFRSKYVTGSFGTPGILLKPIKITHWESLLKGYMLFSFPFDI